MCFSTVGIILHCMSNNLIMYCLLLGHSDGTVPVYSSYVYLATCLVLVIMFQSHDQSASGRVNV